MPVAIDLKWVGLQAVKVLVFARVDLDLELERAASIRDELEDQMRRVGSLIAVAFGEPRQGIPYPVDDAANRLRLRLNQVDVFRIP